MSKDIKLTKELHNFFLPIHENMGFKNSSTMQIIKEVVFSKLYSINGHEANCKYFNFWFINKLSGIVHSKLMNKKSKWFIKGLVCEKVGTLGNYYILETVEEQSRIYEFSNNEINNRKKALHTRVIIEGTKHLQQLEYKK